ncbi:hypothetical protein CUR95_15805 [Bordetella bronchiseptica]|nr:hypothetical protein [Bordetella bronchiseptica]
MPLYDYACPQCGPFRAWRALREVGGPLACPQCGERAPKAVTAPFLADMNPAVRQAHARNEKSAHEPTVASRPAPGHDHGHDHGHGHGHAPVPAGLGPGPWVVSPHRSMVGHH